MSLTLNDVLSVQRASKTGQGLVLCQYRAAMLKLQREQESADLPHRTECTARETSATEKKCPLEQTGTDPTHAPYHHYEWLPQHIGNVHGLVLSLCADCRQCVQNTEAPTLSR